MWVNNLAKQPRIINNKFNAKSLGAQLASHDVSNQDIQGSNPLSPIVTIKLSCKFLFGVN